MVYHAPMHLREALKLVSKPQLNGVLVHVQKAVFETITIQKAGRRKRTTRFEAHVSTLTNLAAHRDRAAAKECRHLIKLAERARTAEQAKRPGSFTSSKHLLRLEAKAWQMRNFQEGFADCLLMMEDEVNAICKQHFGEQKNYLTEDLFRDLPQTVDRMRLNKKYQTAQRRKANKCKPFDVGHKKMPEHARWRTSGNPSGLSKAREKSPIDHLEEELLSQVLVISGEKKTKTSKLAVTVLRLFNEAAKGEATAYPALRVARAACIRRDCNMHCSVLSKHLPSDDRRTPIASGTTSRPNGNSKINP